MTVFSFLYPLPHFFCLSYSHHLWGTAAFLSQTQIPVLLAYFHFPTKALTYLSFPLFSSQQPFLPCVWQKHEARWTGCSLSCCLPWVSILPDLHQQQTRKPTAGPWIGRRGGGTKPAQSGLTSGVLGSKAGISYSGRLYLQWKLARFYA